MVSKNLKEKTSVFFGVESVPLAEILNTSAGPQTSCLAVEEEGIARAVPNNGPSASNNLECVSSHQAFAFRLAGSSL